MTALPIRKRPGSNEPLEQIRSTGKTLATLTVLVVMTQPLIIAFCGARRGRIGRFRLRTNQNSPIQKHIFPLDRLVFFEAYPGGKFQLQHKFGFPDAFEANFSHPLLFTLSAQLFSHFEITFGDSNTGQKPKNFWGNFVRVLGDLWLQGSKEIQNPTDIPRPGDHCIAGFLLLEWRREFAGPPEVFLIHTATRRIG